MKKSSKKQLKGKKKENESNLIMKSLEDSLSKIKKEIDLLQIINSEFQENDESEKFNKANKLLNECKEIFKDIEKGNKDILDKWKNKFKNCSNVDEIIRQMKNYDKIKDKEDFDEIIKNILILTKKDIYYHDIKCILYFIQLFEAEETELSKYLQEKKLEFKDKANFNFRNLININNYLEEKNIYINDGKDDSSLIKFIRLLYNKEKEINYLKKKDVDITTAILYRLNPKIESIKFNDILDYLSCIDFINDFKDKLTDNNLLIKLRTKLAKIDIDRVLLLFKSYFDNYDKLKLLNSKDLYGNIKYILNNSKFEMYLFKREFKVYDDDQKEIDDIIVKDIDGLIKLKYNINLNFEVLPDNIKLDEKQKEELNNKKRKIEIFIKYVQQIQNINNYFSKLENKGCPFFIDITIIITKEKIIYELVNNSLSYDELINKLKEYYNTIKEYQLRFYKENEYFRYVYNKQLYRLYKRLTNKNKDISSFIRFFINDDSIKDEVPLFISRFNDPYRAYRDHRTAVEEKFEFISKYIKNIFNINNTSLDKLYKDIKINDDLRGIYKCNVQKNNMELFLTKMFLKLTGSFPIAQNILLTNNETCTGEIISFIYRAIRCRFNTLFIISINDDLPNNKVNIMITLLNKIIKEMKKENIIKEINDLNPCILFIMDNQLNNSIIIPEAIDLPDIIKGDENKLENNLLKPDENTIYNSVNVYTSDCCGLGKSNLIKKEIKEKGEDYHYFGIGDNITKDELYKKLKKFLKHEIKGKNKIGFHLDLYYTKNTSIMNYFLFSILITKIYQTNYNILYIPKNFNIYVEVPNGHQQFLDDYPILTIFKRINIPLDEENMSCLEKNIYNNIINYLSSDEKDKKINNYQQKIKVIAEYFRKNIYFKKIKELDISQKNKTEKEKRDFIFDLFNIKEEDALNIKYDIPLIFKNKNGYIEIDISDKEIKGKDINYFISNLKAVMSLKESEEEIKEILGNYKITEDNYKKIMIILFKLFANIPIILMGETGCGKTELIKQLMKMLNKDKINNNLIIKNLNLNIKENEIIEIIKKAEENLEETKNDFICIFSRKKFRRNKK